MHLKEKMVKMIQRLSLLLPAGVILLLVWACAGTEKKGPAAGGVYVFDTDTILHQEDFKYSSLFDSVRVIPLDNASFLLNTVQRFKVCPDGWVVWDSWKSQGIALFDRNGAFVRRIGSQGMGPEEYRSCEDIAVDALKGQVYVLDRAGRAVRVYRLPDGGFVRSLPLPEKLWVNRIGCGGGSLYLVKTNFLMDKTNPEAYVGQDCILYRMDDVTGEVTDMLFPYRTHNKGWLDSFRTIENFYRLDNECSLFSFGVMDTLMCITSEGVSPFLALSGEKLVTRQEVESILEEADFTSLRGQLEVGRKLHALGMKEGKVLGVTNVFAHGGNLYFNYLNPALLFAVCSLETGECSSYMHTVDDVFFTSGLPVGSTLFSFLGADGGGVYYVVSTEQLGELTHHVEQGLVSDKVRNAEALRQLDEDSNPVILYYEFKEE